MSVFARKDPWPKRKILWRQIGDKTDHDISCRRSFLIPWKIALRVVVLLSSCRRVLRFVVIWHSRLNHFVVHYVRRRPVFVSSYIKLVAVQSSLRRKLAM